MCLLALLPSTPLVATTTSSTLDYTAPPGANYYVAEFRLWHPDDVATLRGVAMLVPGSNGDGRPMTEDPMWREFAVRHNFALLGLHITDQRHEQMFLEAYVDVSKGSGQAALDALSLLAFGRSANDGNR